MTIMNGINKGALDSILAELEASSDAGAKVPFRLQATWEEGIVRSVDFPDILTCAPPTEVAAPEHEATYKKHPTALSYFPLMGAASFVQSYLIEATKKDIALDKIVVKANSEGNIMCFYRTEEELLSPPWTKLQMNVDVSSSTPLDELKALGKSAEPCCPGTELLTRFHPFRVAMNGVVAEDKEVKAVDPYYNVERYRMLSQGFEEPSTVAQSVVVTWDKPTSDEPDALVMSAQSHEGHTFTLSTGCDSPQAPLESAGKYPTATQALLFGVLASLMHTFAIRFALQKKFGLKSLTGTVEASINYRKVMGLDGTSGNSVMIFIDGGTLHLEVVTNSDQDTINKAFKGAQNMTPTYKGLVDEVEMPYKVKAI